MFQKNSAPDEGLQAIPTYLPKEPDSRIEALLS